MKLALQILQLITEAVPPRLHKITASQKAVHNELDQMDQLVDIGSQIGLGGRLRDNVVRTLSDRFGLTGEEAQVHINSWLRRRKI